MVKAIRYNNEDYNKNFIDVDLWEPNPEDEIFKTCKGVLVLPVSQFFGISETTNLDYFILSTKRCYNGKDMRVHLPKYMNYFEKFYDQDKELLLALFKIKYLIDFSDDYSEEMFMYDVERYILSQSLQNKAHVMNEQNYKLDLDSKKYKNDKNPSLTYKDKHAKILMWMSLLMNMIIPVVTHFIYVKKIEDTNGFLLKVFDIIIQMSDVDIYNKLYETSISNVYKNAKSHSILWEMQDIRGKTISTHSSSAVNNIILNIMPKYTYDNNLVLFNYTSIKKHNYYQVTGKPVALVLWRRSARILSNCWDRLKPYCLYGIER